MNSTKMTRFFAFVLILLLVCPYQLFAAAIPYEPVKYLDFEEIETLVSERSRTVLDRQQTYIDIRDGQDDVEEQLDKAAKDFKDKVYDPFVASMKGGDKAYLENAMYALLTAQLNTLIGQSHGYDYNSVIDLGFSTDMQNYGFIWGMEQLFINYNNLKQEMEKMNIMWALADQRLKVAELKKELGMGTALDVLEAQNGVDELDSAIRQYRETLENIKETFNINLAQDPDTDLLLGPVPRVTSLLIRDIEVDKDYKEALAKSFNVRLARDERDEIKDDRERQFKQSFYRLYDNILDKQKAYETERTKLMHSEAQYKISELKNKLGLLSDLMFANARLEFKNQEVATQKAQHALFQAYREYQWANKGMIFSSNM
jgi:hypothetical protein